jgi:hypothetical protein
MPVPAMAPAPAPQFEPRDYPVTLIGGPLDGASFTLPARTMIVECDCPCVGPEYAESNGFSAELIGEPKVMRHAWLLESQDSDRYRYEGVVV